MSYWITPQYPPEHTGIAVLPKFKDSAKGIAVDDRVAIYEVFRNTDDERYRETKGAKAIVALAEITRILSNRDGKWLVIADIKIIAKQGQCPLKQLHQIVSEIKATKDSTFIYKCSGRVIQIDREEFEKIGSFFKDYISDENTKPTEDLMDIYPEEILKAIPEPYSEAPRKTEWTKTKGGSKVKVNPGIAKRRLIIADYKCEIDNAHVTFTSHTTKRNYVESHHLVPLGVQKEFGENSLDHEANILALCPNCHRQLHHAILNEKKQIIKELYELRVKELEKAAIKLALGKLISYYQ
jgi:hypothetical protein